MHNDKFTNEDNQKRLISRNLDSPQFKNENLSQKIIEGDEEKNELIYKPYPKETQNKISRYENDSQFKETERQKVNKSNQFLLDRIRVSPADSYENNKKGNQNAGSIAKCQIREEEIMLNQLDPNGEDVIVSSSPKVKYNSKVCYPYLEQHNMHQFEVKRSEQLPHSDNNGIKNELINNGNDPMPENNMERRIVVSEKNLKEGCLENLISDMKTGKDQHLDMYKSILDCSRRITNLEEKVTSLESLASIATSLFQN